MLVRSKKKYRTKHTGTFKSKTSNSGGKKKAYRPDGTLIHWPKNAEWPKHPGGTWWGGYEKGRHAA